MAKAKKSTYLGVFNQLSWGGVGDADECWIISTYWALVATGVMGRNELPSISAFREAAGRPDKPGPSGGNNRNIVNALKLLAPEADAKLFVGSFAQFKTSLKAGYVASLSLLSSQLPKYLQFGFRGSHQVSIFYQGGKMYVMNPLAREGSGLIEISEKDLSKAANALFRDGKFHAVLIKQGSKPSKVLPRMPVDFNYQVTVRNYLDPWRAKDRYDERHSRPGTGKPMDVTSRKA